MKVTDEHYTKGNLKFYCTYASGRKDWVPQYLMDPFLNLVRLTLTHLGPNPLAKILGDKARFYYMGTAELFHDSVRSHLNNSSKNGNDYQFDQTNEQYWGISRDG